MAKISPIHLSVTIVIIVVIIDKTDSFAGNRYCGLGNYSIINDLNQRFGFNEVERSYNVRLEPPRQALRYDIKDAFRTNPVVVRLSIFYDDSMQEEWRGDKLNKYIRSLVFQTQLIFDQPEMAKELKVQLVVTSLRSLPESPVFHGYNQPGITILDEFLNITEVADDLSYNRADVCVLMMYRAWFANDNMVGLANSGTFCRSTPYAGLLTWTTDVTQAITLAHELGHVLGLEHDGDIGCANDVNIMSGTGKTGPLGVWSTCSTLGIPNYLVNVADCVYDPRRYKAAQAIDQYFDLELAKSWNERPAGAVPLNEQCRSAYEGSRSLFQLSGDQKTSENLETCQSVVCLVGQRYQVGLGAALTGSPCKKNASGTEGFCVNNICQ